MYHITQPGGTPHGPYTLEQLQALQASGKINAETLYFTRGMDNWASICTLLPNVMPVVPTASNEKSRLAYIILAIFFGTWGVHNFYAGYNGKGLTQLLMTLLSCCILAPIVLIWCIIDICTVNQDAKGTPFSI
ncbi:MAG: NINE protein [Akkermansia sp.]|nr:NINE protein [Akkermansia sp.]MBR3944602.1 NINE protein [Akkermansia sp.]